MNSKMNDTFYMLCTSQTLQFNKSLNITSSVKSFINNNSDNNDICNCRDCIVKDWKAELFC